MDKVCHGCGNSMAKAHAYHGEDPFCTRCYYREFKPVACADCGRNMRTWHGEEPGLCRTCRVKGRVCVKCGVPVPRSHFRTPEGEVACKNCRRVVAPPKPCPRCGRLCRAVVREIKAGFTEPACERCRNATRVTCAGCRKHRAQAGTDSEGRPLCKTCLAGNDFVCPLCGQHGIRHSKDACLVCYHKRYSRERALEVAPMLARPWVRELFLEFIEALLADAATPIRAGLDIQRHFDFFKRLEVAAPTPMKLTAFSMWEEFGRHGLRLNERAYNFLADTGRVTPPSDSEVSELTEADNQRRLIARVTEPWHRDVLIQFQTHLLARRDVFRRKGWTGEDERFLPRSITTCMRAARRLLESLPQDVQSVTTLQQAHLDLFVSRQPGHKNALSGFVQYLNQSRKRFGKLTLSRPGARQAPVHNFLSPARSNELIGKWLSPDEGSVKRSLICLFMLLYGRTAAQAAGLERKQFVRGPDGAWQAKFAKVWIGLAPEQGRLLDRYLASPEAQVIPADPRSRFLFPGRMPNTHLSPDTVWGYLQVDGVTAEELFATCLINAYRNGLQFPKTLVQALGISVATAVTYHAQMDSMAAKSHARRQGR